MIIETVNERLIFILLRYTIIFQTFGIQIALYQDFFFKNFNYLVNLIKSGGCIKTTYARLFGM